MSNTRLDAGAGSSIGGASGETVDSGGFGLETIASDAAGKSATGLARWQVAAMVGVPILIAGAGAYYWYSRSRGPRRRSRKSTRSGDRKGTAKDSGLSSITESPAERQVTPQPLQTPYDRAMTSKNKGNTHFKAGRYIDAIDSYTDAIRLCPIDRPEELATFHQNRAACHENLNNIAAVIDDCTRAIKLNHKYQKALLRRAKAYETMGKMEDALVDVTMVTIMEGFGNQVNLLFTERILKKLSKVKAAAWASARTPSLPSDHFIRHYFMSYSQDPLNKGGEMTRERLERTLDEATESDLQADPNLALLLATAKILRGETDEAEKNLTELLDLENLPPAVRVNALIKLGTLKVRDIESLSDNGLDDSLSFFEKAVEVDPNNADIYLHRAQVYILAERVQKARDDLDACCQLNTNFPSALAQKLYVDFRYGVRFEDVALINSALDGFVQAQNKFPLSSEICSLYAQSLMELQRFYEADEYFNKAIELDKSDANLYVHRGILYLQWREDVEKALDILGQAIKIDSRCQFAHEMMASILVQRGELERGIGLFEKALDGAQAEVDAAHLYQLMLAAKAQLKAADLLGVELPKAT